jgi:hypothetical protein
MLGGMHADAMPKLSDRQARAAIHAAEALGVEREPDLYPAMYDQDLHEDGRIAAVFLGARDPSRLAAALAAAEPIAARCAALRITETGLFSMADADVVLEAAVALDSSRRAATCRCCRCGALGACACGSRLLLGARR